MIYYRVLLSFLTVWMPGPCNLLLLPSPERESNATDIKFGKKNLNSKFKVLFLQNDYYLQQ